MYTKIVLISKPLPDVPAVFKKAAAEVKSVKWYEHYKAKSVGEVPSIQFEIFFGDYGSEKWIEFRGSLWKVERADLIDNNKYRLVCIGVELGVKNCKIKILTRTVSSDSDGFPVISAAESAEIYAFKEDKSSDVQDRFIIKTVMFRFEKDPDITVDNSVKISFEGSEYVIISILEIPGREQFIEVTAVGRVNGEPV